MTHTFNRTRNFNRRGQHPNHFGRKHQPQRFGRRRKTVDPSLLTKKAVAPLLQKAFVPVHTFNEFSIPERLKENIKSCGYLIPTPIQDAAIPPLLVGKDVVGIANTGTGKTAAFLIPLLTKISQDRMQKVLIVAPTRELAVQIRDETKALAVGLNIFATLCIGGVSIRPQVAELRRSPHLVIGTPGRLKDLNMQGKLNFLQFGSIVLDEVDRMLDMGFIHDVRYIISLLPQKRQSLFFSATLTPNVTAIMKTLMRDPVTISVKTQETPLHVDQDIIKTNGRGKLDILHELLCQQEFQKVLVFGRTKWGIERLAEQLTQKGILVAQIHGNKNQNQRQRALSEFKQNKVNVLLATDIASRGLDIPDVTHVINFDLPETYDDYVHRIGRTGRAGKKGIALSLVD